jgi:hypothetical protein
MTALSRYWLDANVLIEANRISYPYRLAKSFWMRLAEQVELGKVVSPRRVFKEWVENEGHKDFVKDWVKVREAQLSKRPEQAVQDIVGAIGLYVFSNPQYDKYESWKFTDGGDPWVIAHAFVDKGTVVTLESHLHPEARKPLIPDVCKKFEVRWVNTMAMFEELGITF